MRVPAFVVLVFLPALACRSGRPAQPPAELAQEIVADLEQGSVDRAAERFAPAAAYADYRDKIYPVLYQAARQHYEAAEVGGAKTILRFMRDRYPKATAVRVALVYVLLIERGAAAQVDPEAQTEMDGVLAELGAASTDLPPWVHLAAAQQAADRGKVADARAALGRFRETWDGEPKELAAYLTELDRFLRSHGRKEQATHEADSAR